MHGRDSRTTFELMVTIERYGRADSGGVGSSTGDAISDYFRFRTGFFGFTYHCDHYFGCGAAELSYMMPLKSSARRSQTRSPYDAVRPEGRNVSENQGSSKKASRRSIVDTISSMTSSCNDHPTDNDATHLIIACTRGQSTDKHPNCSRIFYTGIDSRFRRYI